MTGKRSKITVSVRCNVDGEADRVVHVEKVYRPDVVNEATADAIVDDIFRLFEEELGPTDSPSEEPR